MGNIVLTGFMGTGKSTVGKRLASSLGLRFLDMDDIIEREAGMPVKEIFARYGEPHFRRLEKEAVRGLTLGKFGEGLVIAAGGGAVVDGENRKALRSWAAVVCLTASVDEILKRVVHNDLRPLLKKDDRRGEVSRLLKEREAAYGDSDFTLDTTAMSADDAVIKIKEFLKKNKIL